MLLQCAKRYTVFTTTGRYLAHFLNNYDMDGSLVLQEAVYARQMQHSVLMYGTTEVSWKGSGHRLVKGDTLAVSFTDPTLGPCVFLAQIRSRRAVVQEGAQAANA